MAEQQLTADQVYLQAILEKFNKDQNDPTLQEVERILLAKIRDSQQEISQLTKEVETINTEIRERQEKGNNLVQQIIHKQGQSQGYIDSLLALKK